MTRLERITTDAAVCHGKPAIRGLRYPSRCCWSNIGNDDLVDPFDSRLHEIEAAFAKADHVELRRGAVFAHRRAGS